AFFARVHAPPSGPLRSSLVLASAGATSLLGLEGDPAPGAPAGVVYDPSAFYGYVTAAGGRILFAADLAGPGIDASHRRGLWYRDATGTDLVARPGDPAAGSGPGAVFGGVLGPYRVGDSGEAVFFSEAYVAGAFVESGYWRWSRAAGASQLVITGHPAPG